MLHEVLHAAVVRRSVLRAGDPANVRPEEALQGGESHIRMIIRVLVVVAMVGRPPEGTALHGGITPHGKNELHETRSAEGAMRKVAMVMP